MKKALIILLFLSFAISSCAPKAGANAKSKKTNVAIVTFGDEPESSNALNGLSTKLTEAIVNSGKYIAVNRSEDILKQLGKEHWYQRSDAVDSNQIKELGKQLGVQYLCIVQSSKVMGEYMLEAKFVDVVTAATAPGMMGSELSSLKDTKELMRVAEVLVTKLLGSVSPAQEKTAPPPVQGDVSDGVLTDARDGKKYRIVKIGSQTWMAENLNYSAVRSVCYDNKPENCKKYGRLYDWNTVKEACPSGWHLPSDAEWDVLIAAVDGKETAGKKLKAKSGWYDNGNGTDEFGFSALPGGTGGFPAGSFEGVGRMGQWWIASEYELGDDIDSDGYVEVMTNSYSHSMRYDSNNIWDGYSNSMSTSYSVRCVKD